MFEHLRYRAATIEPRSPAGKHADKILQFNDKESVRYREFIRDIIDYAEGRRRNVEETLRLIDERIAVRPSQQLTQERQEAEAALARVVTNLQRLGAA